MGVAIGHRRDRHLAARGSYLCAIQQDSETINPLWNPPMGSWITPEWILWTLNQHQKWLKLRKTDGRPLFAGPAGFVDPKRLVISQTREDCRGILAESSLLPESPRE